MTQGAAARSYLLSAAAMAAMGGSSDARAGIWYTDPVLGLAAEFSTNPALLYTSHTTETHGAALMDAPTTYHADHFSFIVKPSFRVSDSKGYSSLASDYAHLTVATEIDTERDTWTISGQGARDSSLYSNYAYNGSTGVRRDTTLADAAWTRALTERVKISADLNSSRVLYGSSNRFAVLTDYRYTSAAPSLTWNSSERTTWTIVGNAGVYDSSDGTTRSVNSNLQLGFTRQIDPLWNVNVKAGYSRETDRIAEYFGPYLLGTFKSTNNGTVFSSSLGRQGESFGFTATASRSLVAAGFAFLSRQTSYELSVTYPYTERWSVAGRVRRVTSEEPQAFGPTVSQSYLDIGMSASWLMTEKWTLTLRASRVTARYTPPVVDVGTTGCALQMSRRFDRVQWQ